MGRARKPLAAQTGDLTVARQQQRELEEQLTAGAGKLITEVKPPKALINAEARKLWKWAVELLKDMPLVGEIDALNLEGMCNSFALYRAATDKIKKDGISKDGLDFGQEIVSVMNAQKKYAEEFRAFARLCGFTVDSRLKLAAVKAKDIDNDIEDIFGDV